MLPPAIRENVSLSDIYTDDEGQSIAIVDAPGEDPVSQASGGRGEKVSNDPS